MNLGIGVCLCLLFGLTLNSYAFIASKRPIKGGWTLKSSSNIQQIHSNVEELSKVVVGDFTIISHENDIITPIDNLHDEKGGDRTIHLYNIKDGWGNGKHPTTFLCLDVLQKYVKTGSLVLDYGCGSGILALLASKLGAKECFGVDVDEACLEAARKNVALNKCNNIAIEHTKDIYIGCDNLPLCDVTVANILPGPLTRLVSPIIGHTKPGGKLCLSGMRPHELPAIRRIYSPFVDIRTEEINTRSHEVWGDWVSWTVTTRNDLTRSQQLASLEELFDAGVGY